MILSLVKCAHNRIVNAMFCRVRVFGYWSLFWFGTSNASPTPFVCGNLTLWKSSPHLTLWAASSVVVGSRWGFGSFLSIVCFNLMSLISVTIFIFRFSFDVVWMWSTWNTVRERKTQISKVSSDVITTVPSSCHHCKTLFELVLQPTALFSFSTWNDTFVVSRVCLKNEKAYFPTVSRLFFYFVFLSKLRTTLFCFQVWKKCGEKMKRHFLKVNVSRHLYLGKRLTCITV